MGLSPSIPPGCLSGKVIFCSLIYFLNQKLIIMKEYTFSEAAAEKARKAVKKSKSFGLLTDQENIWDLAQGGIYHHLGNSSYKMKVGNEEIEARVMALLDCHIGATHEPLVMGKSLHTPDKQDDEGHVLSEGKRPRAGDFIVIEKKEPQTKQAYVDGEPVGSKSTRYTFSAFKTLEEAEGRLQKLIDEKVIVPA